MNSTPSVTIAIVSNEDESRIESCLMHALEQDYPRELVEIVVADAMSMDATREIVLRLAARDARVRLLDNPERTRAAALNAIIQHSTGEIVVPMDPGGDYGRTHVEKCVLALSEGDGEELVIFPRTSGRTFVERALSAAQKTRLAFAAGAELARGAEPAHSLLGAIRRRVFDKVGLYDPEATVEEDAELSQRIARAGGTLLFPREIVVHKTDARSFRELFRQHYLLGRSRARRAVRERKVPQMGTLAPLVMFAGFGVLALTSSVQPLTPVALAAYALATGAAAVRVAREEGAVAMPIAWAAYPVMHVAHGVGFGAGLVRTLVKPGWRAVPWPTPA